MGTFLGAPVPNASKPQFGNVNLGSSGPLFGKSTRGSQSDVWAAAGAKAQAKRSTGATSWVYFLQKNLEAFGVIPRKGKGRKWVAFGAAKNGQIWMIAAQNVAFDTGGQEGSG